MRTSVALILWISGDVTVRAFGGGGRALIEQKAVRAGCRAAPHLRPLITELLHKPGESIHVDAPREIGNEPTTARGG